MHSMHSVTLHRRKWSITAVLPRMCCVLPRGSAVKRVWRLVSREEPSEKAQMYISEPGLCFKREIAIGFGFGFDLF